ncbi:MAG: nucleoside phosphorylase [Firmicutes bacterium]|nr:nucleoside phosphorylase [Bacillota bacterium]
MKEILPILKIPVDSLPPDVLVCGDPARAEAIARELEQTEELAYNREYRTFIGRYQGAPLAVCSHGVGAAGAAVCFEELIRAGARRLIRVGTAGSLSSEIRDGDLVIASAAVREDGLTEQLVPLSFPAVADIGVTRALEESARKAGVQCPTGIVLTVAAFYPALLDLPNNLMSKARCLAVEMECAALFVIAALKGVQAGAVLAIDGMAIDFDADAYNPHREAVHQAVSDGIGLSLEAAARLAKGEA